MNEFQLIADFLTPTVSDINLITLGDNIDKKIIKNLSSAINIYQLEYYQNVNENNTKPITNITHINTHKLFKGSLEPYQINENSTIIYLDNDLSELTIRTILNYKIDELDHMLVSKYIINQTFNKHIFNLTNLNNKTINHFSNHLDRYVNNSNYFIDNHHLALWILDKPFD
jgi:5S rRNA maturation endonuclease (ribonuclease M5)